MLVLVKPLTNRSKKRAAKFEYKKLFDRLFEVEKCFYHELFGSNYTYNESYTVYLKFYQDVINWINENIKPDYYAPDLKYFEKNFKPIEHD